MRKLMLPCTLLCAMVPAISPSPAHAQNVLWVSSSGLDSNACSQASPCATFQGAISKGSVSQINCLNSGNYGSFTVTGSITIDCGAGNIGTVVVGNGAAAILLNTASAATVILRHLSLNGLGTASRGIATSIFSGGALIVEDCTIQGFAAGGDGFGIHFFPSGGRSLLQLSNSQVLGNNFGIVVLPSSGQIASVTLNRVELTANANIGLSLAGAGVVAGTMRDSVVGANGVTGVSASSSQVFFTIEESSITANLSNGIQAGSAGTVVNVGGSTIGGNGTGVRAVAGSIISFGNNHISANGSNGSFTTTTALQ